MKANRAPALIQNREQSPAHRFVRLAGKGPAALGSPAARWAVNIVAVAGAALLAWSGLIHLRLWADGYRSISVIGPLFLAQGVSSVAVAAALAAFRRLALIAAGASALAATAVSLLLSVYGGLFGYKESLAVPYARSSLVIEFTGAALLTGLAIFVTAMPGRDDAARATDAFPA